MMTIRTIKAKRATTTMKILSRLVLSTLFAACVSSMLVACSSDNDGDDNGHEAPVVGINPTEVFTGKRIKDFNGAKMTYNEEGLLTNVKSPDESVTFVYPTGTTTSGNHIKMTICDKDPLYGKEMYIDMTIGTNGFVESAIETYENTGGKETWKFEYNEEGHLYKMKRSEGGNETTTLTYTGNNIAEVDMTSEKDPTERQHVTLSYGSTPMENKACIMLFDETFGIDMDEMIYAYWAGLLGKATRHLPTAANYEDEGTETFKWDVDGEGYPSSMTHKSGHATYTYQFGW